MSKIQIGIGTVESWHKSWPLSRTSVGVVETWSDGPPCGTYRVSLIRATPDVYAGTADKRVRLGEYDFLIEDATFVRYSDGYESRVPFDSLELVS